MKEMNVEVQELGLERRAGITALLICIGLVLLTVIVPGNARAADEIFGGDTTALAMGVLVLAVAVILVLYLIYGKKEQGAAAVAEAPAAVEEALPDVDPVPNESGNCARCGQKLLASWDKCPDCTMGKKALTWGDAGCPNCGEYTMKHWAKCPSCGKAL